MNIVHALPVPLRRLLPECQCPHWRRISVGIYARRAARRRPGRHLFAIAPQPDVERIREPNLELRLWYLDDGILVGTIDTIKLKLLKEHLPLRGFELNLSKCKLFGPAASNPDPDFAGKYFRFAGMSERKRQTKVYQCVKVGWESSTLRWYWAPRLLRPISGLRARNVSCQKDYGASPGTRGPLSAKNFI